MGKNRALDLCTLLLTAFLVLSAMHAVPAEAGRALAQTGYEPLNPYIPSFPGGTVPGRPYTRPCTYKERCDPPHFVHEP
ncbi:hypothetical protein QOZ80_2BG0171130 [Eleusine coracana subsp. coracana]|nr:hypothetical protein QOZ80_2BG0171130 [Eleusine coracana subsp. coracana]